MKPHSRKLQESSYNDMSFQPLNTRHKSTSASPPPQQPPSEDHQYPNPPFESCMALTVLVLLIALFFMAFFSIYIRRFSGDTSTGFSSGRRAPPSPHPRAAVGFFRGKGVDPEVIKSLPVFGYYCGEAKYQIECAICLGEFEEEETVKMIPYCKHVFHLECIDTWLEMHVTCPVCRGTELFEVDTKVCGGCRGGGPPSRIDVGVNGPGGRSTVDNGHTCIEDGTFSVGSRSGSC